MKPETKETTQQNTTQGKKYKSIKADYFYKKFCAQTKYRKNLVSFKLYKKIIQTFLKVYFGELYLFKKTSYFFLGGHMKLVLGKGSVWNNHLQTYITNHINLFWFDRLSAKTYYEVKCRKMAGSTSQIKKIERFYMKNYDKELLPIFTVEQEKGKRNKRLFYVR